MFAALVCLAFWVVVGILVARMSREQERFRERFPPISDSEFLALCSPGTRPDAALGVRRIVAETLGVEYHRVYPSSSFVEDLGAD
jgi:hypothetical protein